MAYYGNPFDVCEQDEYYNFYESYEDSFNDNVYNYNMELLCLSEEYSEQEIMDYELQNLNHIISHSHNRGNTKW